MTKKKKKENVYLCDVSDYHPQHQVRVYSGITTSYDDFTYEGGFKRGSYEDYSATNFYGKNSLEQAREYFNTL